MDVFCCQEVEFCVSVFKGIVSKKCSEITSVVCRHLMRYLRHCELRDARGIKNLKGLSLLLSGESLQDDNIIFLFTLDLRFKSLFVHYIIGYLSIYSYVLYYLN